MLWRKPVVDTYYHARRAVGQRAAYWIVRVQTKQDKATPVDVYQGR